MTYSADYQESSEAEWLAEAEATANLEGELPTMPNLPEDAIPIPLATEVHQAAQACAAQQRTPEKAEQVRRNLLAVLSVWNYLRIQGYGLELEASDCWNPILRQMNDVADLIISGIGRLECRVFEPDQELCLLPDEVQVDRVGYVAVQFDAEERWAWLLGFAPALSLVEPVEGIRRAELHSMDEFGGHLNRLRQANQILTRKLDSPRLQTVSQLLENETELSLDAILREEAVAMLERLYRTVEDYERPDQAATEILEFVVPSAPRQGELVMLSEPSEGSALQQAAAELNMFFHEVFLEFNQALENEG